MRRWFACLPLLIALGCTLAPDNKSRQVTPTDDAGKVVADDSKRLERLPLPHTEEADQSPKVEMERLARTDPTAFLARVIDRYEREVRGYRCTLEKRERVKGTLRPLEIVRCAFREKPFSVLMDWEKGAGRASKTLYIKGQNNGNLLALPSGLLGLVGVVERKPDGPEASATSRYPVTKFGIHIGHLGTLSDWRKAKDRDGLTVTFNGTKRIKELGDREVWELKRTKYLEEEFDGIMEATFYFDTETWLQVGTILKNKDGELVASYFFRNVELNPTFPADTFTKAALTKK